MSSEAVRTAILAAITPLADPWEVFDLSDYNELPDVLPTLQSESVLVQFLIADDEVMNIGGEGNQGWQETGTVVVYLVVPTGSTSESAVTKGDEIRTGIRGRRLTSELTVESMSPFVDYGPGDTGIAGAVHSFASSLFYVNRTCG